MPIQQIQTPKTSGDMVTVITDYLKKNNGNAEQAFYAIAKDYNVDPTPLVNEIKAMKDPKGFAEDLIKNNPQINQILTLLSNIK